jgi:hypothetical protein
MNIETYLKTGWLKCFEKKNSQKLSHMCRYKYSLDCFTVNNLAKKNFPSIQVDDTRNRTEPEKQIFSMCHPTTNKLISNREISLFVLVCNIHHFLDKLALFFQIYHYKID